MTEAEDTSTLSCAAGSGAPRGTMGIPRAMYTYERLPFWATFFKSCGFDVMLSRQTDKKIRELGIEGAVAEPCFPIRVAHGHVAELIEEGADHIFLPNLLNEETDHPGHRVACLPLGPDAAARHPLRPALRGLRRPFPLPHAALPAWSESS